MATSLYPNSYGWDQTAPLKNEEDVTAQY